ncbi:MAG: hypothetical protein JO304_24210 [Solirubrobacterales bacterium]|nr:hypothetical protein [Solirubrobacterales bacterium]
MLASITPLGERGRHSTWGVTVTAFLLGATLAGAAAGAAVGALGSLVLPTAGLSSAGRLAVLAGAVAVAIGLDASPRAVPGPRRQVNERWLEEYRGWVYGAGYGSQLGLGLTTVVSSAATYVAVLAAFLASGAVAGALVLGCFGAVRGLTPLVASRVRSPRELLALHAVLTRWRDRGRWAVVGLEAMVLGLVVAVGLVGV